MPDAAAPWPPRVGDYVHVIKTGGTGEVTEITGAGEAQQFVVAIWSSPENPPSTAQVVLHRLCTLDELSPMRRP